MSHPVEPTVPAPVATPVPPAPAAPVPAPGLSPEALKLIDDANKRAEAAQAVAEDLQKKFADTTHSLEGLSKDAAERKAAEDKAREEAEAAARTEEEEKLDVKALLAKREEEFNARLDKFQREAEEKQALMEMEVRFQQLKAYTQGKIADAKDEILPELYDYITGSTPEEVDASIELAKQKSQGIAQAAKAARTGHRATTPGVSANTGPSQMGSTPELPDEDGSEESILRQLANDNPNAMANYAKLRERMNIGRAGTGLFG
jgi:hypothetical protein